MSASEDAEAAASRAGVTISVAGSMGDVGQATSVWAAVWPKPTGEPAVPAEIARAVAHSGNYLSIARRDGEPVGAALAFRGVDRDGPLVHSHIAGVLPGLEHRGAGYALKMHQRAWALDNGIDRITWTFDPLVARNAFFNLTKLGAEVVEYLVDFYGHLDDGINSGDETDRALVMWSLTSARAIDAAAGCIPPRDASNATVVLAPDASGWPAATPLPQRGDAVIQVPADIVALRANEPGNATAWRKAARDVFVDALRQGWTVTGATRDCRYVLTRNNL